MTKTSYETSKAEFLLEENNQLSIKQRSDGSSYNYSGTYGLVNSNDNNLKLSRYYYDFGSSNEVILTALGEESEDAINRVLEILQNRIDQFGVAEPTIQKQGNQRIIVELAGVQDSDRARSLLESTALLEFFIVKDITTTNELMVKIDQTLIEKTKKMLKK